MPADVFIKILSNTEISRGTRWLKAQVLGESPLDYEPGTVLGLAFKQGSEVFRHPYTVSRADASTRTLEFLYRVIPHGHMTPLLAAMGSGSELKVVGRGGHPISAEVDTEPKGIVLVSTGAGIGPIYGFSQLALERGSKLPIKLVAGFREQADTCLQNELRQLADQYPNFEWHYSLSQPDAAWKGLRGHVTESLPQVLGPVRDLHFHLVGNGNMVVELHKVLKLVGLKEERVTSEIYFNYMEKPDPERLRELAGKYRF